MDFDLLHHIYRFPGVTIDENSAQDEAVCEKLINLFVEFSKHMAEQGSGIGINAQNSEDEASDDDYSYSGSSAQDSDDELSYDDSESGSCAQDSYSESSDDYVDSGSRFQEPMGGHSQACYQYASERIPGGTQGKYLAPSIKWFPAYGCAVVSDFVQGDWSSEYSIHVIGLDGHELEVHSGQGSYQYTSVAKSYSFLHVGTISIDVAGAFKSRFEKMFEERSRKKGDDRSAAGGKQGHQKTPAFIHAILLQAIDGGSTDVQPKGGFTDVGLHTGGQKRDTCYALARAVFHFFLDQGYSSDDSSPQYDKVCFEPVMVHFHMYLLNKAVAELDFVYDSIHSNFVEPVLDSKVEYIFHILKYLAVLAARLSDDDYNLRVYYDRMKAVRERIEGCLSKWDKATLEKNSCWGADFEPYDPIVDMPVFIPPQKVGVVSTQNICDASRLPSKRNLKEAATWAQHQVQKEIQHSNTKLFAFLREIENFFWDISKNNFGSEPVDIGSHCFVMTMIDCYREAVEAYSKSDYAGKSTLLNRIHSVELLVVWVGYCAIFNSFQYVIPDTMAGFGVALHYQDLKYLVLHDETHLMVVERVAQFLHDNYVNDMELFSAREDHQSWDSPTFIMGERYVAGNKHMRSIWLKEHNDAEQRVSKHWREVVKKQNLARRLRKARDKLKSDREVELPKADEWYCDEYMYRRRRTPAARRAQEKVDMLTQCIADKEIEIRDAEEAPPPVIQPLPQDKSKAMKVLFFLYMPEQFRYLSRLSYTAQQLLVPKPWNSPCGGSDGVDSVDIFGSLKVTQNIYYWDDHYNENQECCHHQPNEQRTGNRSYVSLSMHNPAPEPEYIRTLDVDDVTCQTQDIWYPDELNVRLVWNGGKYSWDCHSSREEFNPFRINGDFTASYFTEKLSEDFSNLQWSLIVLEKDSYPPTHGNRPYASLDLKPSSLSKEGFLDYCSVRRFPCLALRKLCGAMKRGSLPLQHEFVQKLVRQTLYQVGKLCFTNDKNSNPILHLQWRENDIEEICTAYISILQAMSDIQTQKPNLSKASAMIGEMAGYFSCLPGISVEKDTFRVVAIKLAEAAMKWGYEYDDEIEKASPEKRPLLRSKQVIFFRTAIMCVVHGEIDDLVAEIILKCIVRAQNIFLRGGDESFEHNTLKHQCEYILTNKLHRYLEILLWNKGTTLSKALRAVIGSAPEALDWRQELKSHVLFTARDANHGQSYTINALTGVILVNGLPPNQLPTSITAHAIYRKIFSKNNFEVTMKSGFFETTHPVCGCYYRFHRTTDALVVQESTHEELVSGADPWDDPLELLDSRRLLSLNAFPKKLQTSFSHWGCRKHGIIVFRSFDFKEREIHYIYSAHYKMKCVPEYLDVKNDWRTLARKEGEMDALVVHGAKFLDILERFEMRCMMITKNTHSHEYCINLHRFALNFRFSKSCDRFDCSEVAGYHLRPYQHLSGHLRGLHQYLVLDSDDGNKMKVIIPFGNIALKTSEGVRIDLLHTSNGKLCPTKDGAEEEMHFFTYEVHPRFGTLIANSLNARLFLAGLYIATSTSIPDSSIGMTGEAKAIELLRHCLVNRPLSVEENHCLKNVQMLSKSRSPSCYLLCHDIEQNCTKYAFLFGIDDQDQGLPDANRFSDEGTVYMNTLNKPLSPRLLLNEEECQRCLGLRNPNRWVRSRRAIRQLVDIDKCPVKRKVIIGEIYNSLDDLWEEEVQTSQSPFPLSPSYGTPLEKCVFGELEESWKLHCKEKKIILRPNALYTLYKVKDLIRRNLRIVEEYLAEELSTEFSSHWHAQALQLLRLVDVVPSATKQDMMSIACNRTRIREFNPLLSAKAQTIIYNSILLWLELCVESNRLDFLLSFAGASDLDKNTAFIEEIVARRKWEIKQHPYWLVFEAEQEIRIRPEQYEVANHLIHNNGTAIQLNMGRGKTRVILPMLILFWSFSKDKRQTPRLIILSKLLREGCDYFHNVLCGSVLGRRLFVLPFQRDIELDKYKVRLLQDMVKHCRRGRGFFVVAPEHRLSMQLKLKELHLSGDSDLCKGLQNVISSDWCDIIDEVDEVLHHRFQLVYSTGTVQPLPQGRHRWEAIEALLETLKKAKIAGLQVTQNSDMQEAFPRINIDDNIDVPKFRQHLVGLLLNDPPFRFIWLKGHNKSLLISRIMTLPDADPKELHLSEEHRHDVLSFRGLLAFDILLHCLRKRHRVDFGVNKEGRKRLSVPFRGADTPSQRAEFSHPDCAIVYTILAYYDHGLDRRQTEKAFDLLLEKGKNARTAIFNEWLSTSKHRMAQDTYESINNANKIDLTNSAKVEVLFEHFCRNPGTINLWLNSCVFPSEIDQYPQRLVANSWYLTHHEHDDYHCIGFSGTNDNHQILPLRIKQHLPWKTQDMVWRNLLATNGRMLDVMMKRTILCEELEEGLAHETLLSYIRSCCSDETKCVDALIDSGALLAGQSNFSVAQFILKECLYTKNFRLRGVTFFDEERNMWMILETSGRCMKKEQSPLMERDTFALFDEPRCRGVDLKLRGDAVAVLTLGQNICKDKVMQAAGRMRQLGRGQGIVVVGGPKVFKEIRRINKTSLSVTDGIGLREGPTVDDASNVADVTIRHVLSWIMHNTIESIWKGLGVWSEQGIFYATATKPEHAIFDENLDLEAFYGKPIHEAPVAELATSVKEYHCNRTGGGDDIIMDEITQRCITLGTSYKVMRTGADEECERELEREVEEEEEEEMGYSRMVARSEVDWDYSSIFMSESARKLPIKVYSISYFMRNYLSCKSLAHINWSKHVFCSLNFMKTIKCDGKLDEFLRIPDSLVCFPNGDILLLSDWEANQVLPLFQYRDNASFSYHEGYYFGHYSFENESHCSSFLRLGKNGAMSTKIACSLKLFNGETIYPGFQKDALKSMLSGAMGRLSSGEFNGSKASGEPENLVSARRKDADLDRSDLERICTDLTCVAEVSKGTTGSLPPTSTLLSGLLPLRQQLSLTKARMQPSSSGSTFVFGSTSSPSASSANGASFPSSFKLGAPPPLAQLQISNFYAPSTPMQDAPSFEGSATPSKDRKIVRAKCPSSSKKSKGCA